MSGKVDGKGGHPCRAWLPQESHAKDASLAELSFPLPLRHEECLGFVCPAQGREAALCLHIRVSL